MNETHAHRALAQAIAAGKVELAIDYRAANRSGAPGYSTADIVVPPFVLIVISAYLALTQGPMLGLALLLIGGAAIWQFLRPIARARALDRFREKALAKLEHWQSLWQMGALALATSDGEACRSPDGDWRAFATGRGFAP